MVVEKDINTLSNSEIRLYEIELTNEFESTKAKIEDLCKELESLDKIYNKLQTEKSKRNI